MTHIATEEMVVMKRRLVFSVFAACLAIAACNKSQSADSSTGSPQAPQAAQANAALDINAAREVFTSRCAACHGAEGKGNGPGAVALNPKPRNYHDRDWQSRVTDDDIKKTITFGGAAVGKSPMMPASPDLEQKPEVVDGLVRLVRDFGKS